MNLLHMNDEELREHLTQYPPPAYRFCCHIDSELGKPCFLPAEWMIVYGGAPDDWTDSCTEHLGYLMTDAFEHRVFNLSKGEI